MELRKGLGQSMAYQNMMKSLYVRLRAAGINRAYVKGVALPSWWDDSIAKTEAGLADAIGMIGTHLGIPLDILWNAEAPITCPDAIRTKFKKAHGVSDDDLKWPRCISLSVAALAVEIAKKEFSPLPSDPSSIRDEILANGHPWVTLEAILDYLWDHGIPVLHVNKFPTGKKMAGLAAPVQGRPVIVVAKNHAFQALMLFDVAHELGHILCNHIKDNVIFDARIQRLTDHSDDPDEKEANDAAAKVLMGKVRNYSCADSFITGPQLAAAVKVTSLRDHVDPGIIAQNYGYGVDFFPVASAACKIIEDGMENPVAMVRRKMKENLQLEDLSDERLDFLMEIAAGGRTDAVSVG